MSGLMSARTHVIMLAGAIVATITAQAQAGRYVPDQALDDPGVGRATSPEAMPDGLRQAVSAAIERDAYRIRPAAGQDGPPVYEAVNRVNDLGFRFRADGVEAAPRAAGEPAWHLRMTLAGLGYEGEVQPVDGSAQAVKMHVEGNRVEYHHRIERPGDQAGHASVVEWYVNERRGLEQGFTLAPPPGRSAGSSSPLRLNLAVSGDLTPAPAEGSSSVRFLDGQGAVALRYGHLRVFDATGRELPARLASAPGTLSIVVDDREAVYPLTIDPLFDCEVKLTASDAAAYEGFGQSVSISGDTAIVGTNDNGVLSSPGWAYIFQRDQGGPDNWGEVTKLTASDAAADDLFGDYTSISGDTAIVGARGNDDAGGNSGSAYIFQRDQGGPDNWGEVTKLTASDAAAEDYFGMSVSISGDTAIVGAWWNDGAGTDSGSAYLFFRGPVYNTTQDTSYLTIQAAIDNANDYDVIEVGPRTYYEAIDLGGLGITLRSTDGAEVTTIDATGIGTSVVTCANGEGPDTLLDGFTITGGTGSSCYTDYTCGGGLYNDSSSPTVTNCRFIGNTAALSGGGMGNYGDSHPTVINCTFSGNAAAQSGGGIDNRDTSSPTVTNCTFSQNWGWCGGGMCTCDPGTGATVTNSVFWGNEGNFEATVEAAQITGWGLVIDYSCVQGWTGALGGVGNTGADPLLVDPDGPDDEAGTADDNPRLSGGSAAINAGTNSPPGGLPDTDLDGNPRIVAGIVDMGAYESLEVVHNLTQDTYHATIQAAIDLSTNGDGIEVLRGTYNEAIDFGGRALTVHSIHGPEVTTIDADGSGTVVTCDNGEGPSTVLEGFTITGGTGTACGGQMCGGGMYNLDGASPTVINCTFSGNTAGAGGGMFSNSSSPTVINCRFIGNIAALGGGGMFNGSSSPTVINCTFSGNEGGEEGGGMYNVWGSPTVTNCTFTLNVADVGGAMHIEQSAALITNCILWGNQLPEIFALSSPSPTVTYSDVQDATGEPWFGTGCIDVDPLFIDADGPDDLPGTADDNVRLSAGSLCIDAGSNGLLPLDDHDLDGDGDTGERIPIDLDGHARVLCDVVDMGAYEFGIGDYNCDQVMDLTDFGSWPDCMTGPDAGPYPAGCDAFDFEYDADVDLQDFSEFSLVCSP